MKACIVIVTYNRLELLKECVECALNQNNVETELVVVNNNSSDGTFEYLNNLDDKRISVINEIDNIGGAGGFHNGLKYAMENTDTDWFLLIDDDAMINKDYLSIIKDNLTPSVKAYAGTVMVDNKIDTSHRLKKGSGAIPREQYKKEIIKCDFATFCGLVVSRDLVNNIGLPRKDFFIWHDDTEYCYRIRKESDILVVSNAILNHKTVLSCKENKTTSKDNWKWYYGFRNELVIYRQEKMFKEYALKYLKLVLKAIQFRIIAIFDITNRDTYIYNSQLRIAAIHDSRCGNMGKNNLYP